MTPATRTSLAATSLAALTWIVLMAGGCAQVAREAAREAAPSGIASGLNELSHLDNRQALDQLARSEAVQSLGYHLGDSVTAGVVDRIYVMLGLLPEADADAAGASPTTRSAGGAIARSDGGALARSDGDAAATAPATTRAAASRVGPANGPRARLLDLPPVNTDRWLAPVGQGIDRHVRPAASAMARDITAEVVRQISRSVQEDLGPAIAAMIQQQIGPAVGRAMNEQIGPAARQAVTEQLAPAIREAARQGVAGAMEGATVLPTGNTTAVPVAEVMSRQVARGATLGVADAATQSGLAPEALGNVNLQPTIDRVLYLAVALLAVAGLMTLGLMVGMLLLAWSLWRSRPAAVATHPGTNVQENGTLSTTEARAESRPTGR